jgi:hypothetical protein
MAVGVAVAVMASSAAVASAAQLQSWGDPLTDPANVTFGCEAVPTIGNDFSGNYVLVGSNQPDCTWYNTAGGTVPGGGVVQSVTITSGPRPARIRFVVVRTLAAEGFGTKCCFFAGESGEFQPAPNSTQTFRVNLRVARDTDTRTGVITADTIGVSAVSGTGTLPVHDSGRHNLFDPPDPGNSASWLYPRFGSAQGDNGGGRSPGGVGGYRVLIRVGFCPDGQMCATTTGVPAITRPALVPNVFRVAPGPTPVTARVSSGAQLSFTLSQAGTATIAIQRPSGRNRWRTVGTLTRKGLKAGKRSIRFTGRIGTKALSPGSYRVAITVKNSSRRVSKIATAGFRIVR